MDNRLHTKKFPRTLTEAFGPYAGTRYVRAKARRGAAVRVALGIVVAVIVGMAVFLSRHGA